jgi:hypothetical protein
MSRAMKHALAPLLLMSLAACSGMPGLTRDQEPPVVIEAVSAGGPQSIDTNPTLLETDEIAPPAEPRFLGFSVTSLGDASLPGLWLETPFVRAETPGRVIAENGRQLDVMLRPTGGTRGSGSRLSLDGFTALGIPLTALTTLTVVGL